MYDYRELSESQNEEVIRKSLYCRLSVSKGKFPYTIPMYYHFERTDDAYLFFLESSIVGHKMNAIRRNERVCLEFESIRNYRISSVVARGIVQSVSTQDIMSGIVTIVIRSLKISGRQYRLRRKNCNNN